MPLTPNYNLITFLYGTDTTQRIQLTMSGDIVVKGGLQCEVFSGLTSYTERGKLPDNLINIIGAIELWWSAAPTDGASPDVTLNGIALVDCVPEELGLVPGATTIGVVSWRLSFADHRHGFAEPRGGRLIDGLGNPDPLNGATLIDCQTLATKCLTAMGVSTSAPGSMSDTSPPRQIEWYGAHAPSELARLLQHTGHVYCPLSGGTGIVQQPGTGDLPTPPSDRLIADLTVYGVSRLPQIAVFISAPNSVVRTYNESVSSDNATTWEFVAQDPGHNYQYKALADISVLGGDPVSAVKNGFPGAAPADVRLLNDQVYKLIRLKSDRFNTLQSPLLHDVLFTDGTCDDPHLVAKVAVQGRGGAWINTAGVRLNARTVDGTRNVLAFDQRLGTVDPGDERSEFDPFFKPLDVADLKPTFSVEDWNNNKVYAVFGFEIADSAVTAMAESAARDCLSGYRPNVGIYPAPELRFIWLNDSSSNSDALNTAAHGLALAVVSGGVQPRTIKVAGFYGGELNGRVSEIRYSQQGLSTIFIIDGWGCAGGGGLPRREFVRRQSCGGDGDKLGGSIIKPTSRTSSAARDYVRTQHIEQGGSLARPQSQPTTPALPTPTGFRTVIAKVSTKISTGRYTGRTSSGNFSKTATGDFNVGELGVWASADDCEIRSINGLSMPLQVGQPVICLAGPITTPSGGGAGKLILFHAYVPTVFQVVVYQDGGSDGSGTSAASWTYTVKTIDGVQIATGVSVYKTRPHGEIDPAPTGSYGLAFLANNQFFLWDVTEVPPSFVCTDPSGSGSGAASSGSDI